MEFEMRLNKEYFKEVENGTKKYEIRLNDKKRKEINVGDTIVFSNRDNMNEKEKVEVTSLEFFSNFNGLLNKIDVSLIASNITKEELINRLNDIYTAEEVSEYGVVAIGINKI